MKYRGTENSNSITYNGVVESSFFGPKVYPPFAEKCTKYRKRDFFLTMTGIQGLPTNLLYHYTTEHKHFQYICRKKMSAMKPEP